MNRKILIVGASSGLGYALSEYFKDEDIITFSRKLYHPISSKHCYVDINNEDDVNYGFRTINELNWGPVTHLIITAGVYGELEKFAFSNPYKWINTIHTNLIGPAIICHKVIPSMIEKKYGKIVLLSGGGATKPIVGASAYSASKCGLVRFAETIAHELYEYNIDVNCVAPGLMNTKFVDQAIKAGSKIIGKELFYDSKYIKGLTKQEDFKKPIELIDWLLSKDSDGVSGKLISAVHDNWVNFYENNRELDDWHTLRRIDNITRSIVE